MMMMKRCKVKAYIMESKKMEKLKRKRRTQEYMRNGNGDGIFMCSS